VAVTLIEHKFTNNAPRSAAGDAPFTGAPFSTPSEVYFAHADAVLNFAAARDIKVLLSPVADKPREFIQGLREFDTTRMSRYFASNPRARKSAISVST
jgi:hypothetical protein